MSAITHRSPLEFELMYFVNSIFSRVLNLNLNDATLEGFEIFQMAGKTLNYMYHIFPLKNCIEKWYKVLMGIDFGVGTNYWNTHIQLNIEFFAKTKMAAAKMDASLSKHIIIWKHDKFAKELRKALLNWTNVYCFGQ